MRSFIRIVALAVALVIPGSAFAQQYPSKPVKIIVPFPPAGVTDIVGRLVAQKLSEKLGEQFYLENIAGAGGNLGIQDGVAIARRTRGLARLFEHRSASSSRPRFRRSTNWAFRIKRPRP